MKNTALVIGYDGTHFVGFQSQKGLPTVQQELETALATVLRSSVKIHCCGRTDAGVHATGQVVSFYTPGEVPEERRLLRALNALLPRSISVHHAVDVPESFHPRFSCLAREYEYLIWNSPIRPVHLANNTLWFRGEIPVEQLNEELRALIGEHDFASFTRHQYRDESTVRYIDRADLKRIFNPITHSDELVVFRIRGNAFLHNMIRILVGTLLDRARGKLSMPPGEILAQKRRVDAGATAPPHGLFFRAAYYPVMPGIPHLKTVVGYPSFRKPRG